MGQKLLEELPDTLLDDSVLISSAIHMLMKFGDVPQAERLFQKLNKKSIVTYGAMMKGKCE